MSRLALIGVVLTALIGCQSSTKLVRTDEIIARDDGDYKSIVEVKIEKYEKLVEEYPREPKHRERLAAFYWQAEDHRNALVQLAAARDLNPTDGKFDYMEGRIYQDIGNYSLARAAFNRVIAKMPSSGRFTGPFYDLAWISLELDQYDDAIQNLGKCLEIDPVDPSPHYYLGKIYMEQLNDREKAITSFEDYVRLGGRTHQDEVHQILLALQPELRPKFYFPGEQ